MIRILIPREKFSDFQKFVEKLQNAFVEFYEESNYEEKLFSDHWHLVFGEKPSEYFEGTLFVKSDEALHLAVNYLNLKLESESLKTKYDLLFGSPELQGPVIKKYIFEVEKLFNTYDTIALLGEKGVHLHVYVDFVTGGKYKSVTYDRNNPGIPFNGTIFIDEFPGDEGIPRHEGKLILGIRDGRRPDVPFVEIPSLRDRREDIPYMVDRVLSSIYQRYKEFKPRYPEERLMEVIKQYSWPGNTDELIVFLHEYASGSNPEKLIMRLNPLKHLEDLNFKKYVKNLMEYVERNIIKETLEKVKWDRKKACEILKLNYKTLSYKMKKYGLTKPGS